MNFKMDIGSIFPIYTDSLPDIKNSHIDSGRLNFSLGREAILITALLNKKNKTVMIPAYTCHTCIEPYLQEGFEVYYYGINKDLTINSGSFLKILEEKTPGIVFVSPYYGIDFSENELKLIEKASRQGVYIVMDLTQNIFFNTKYDFIDAYVGSYRKWTSIPDGGFIEFKDKKDYIFSKKLLEESDTFTEFTDLQFKAMKLRGDYFVSHDENIKLESRNLYKDAVEVSDTGRIKIHQLSEYSLRKLETFFNGEDRKQRCENFIYLDNNIKFNSQVKRVYKDKKLNLTGPLYYPIYCTDREKVQQALINEKVYAAILWPLTEEKQLINEDTKFIYNSILCIPVAQIYDEKDMKRIVNVLNNLVEK